MVLVWPGEPRLDVRPGVWYIGEQPAIAASLHSMLQGMETMADQLNESLLETWAIHNRIHHYLLEAIGDEALAASMSGRGRTVYGLFSHIHNVRVMWLKASAPELLDGIDTLDGKATGTCPQLSSALTASGEAVAILLRQSLAAGGRIKGFKPHAVAFLGYLISHESHHRGQIEWALRLANKPLSDKVSYGLWEWGTRSLMKNVEFCASREQLPKELIGSSSNLSIR